MKKELQEAIKDFNKKHGDGSLVVVDSKKESLKIETISTGSLKLDKVFGCGGMPRGRMVELFGEESSGKTTLATYLVSQVQKQGGQVVWIDAEFSFSRDYAEKIGVNVKDLVICQPNNGEEALDAVAKMSETEQVDLIVLDSVAALIPQRELEGEIADAEMAQQARMMSKGMRYLAGIIAKTKTIVIFINQERSKIGVYYGKKSTTPGGKALKFYASVRLEVKRGESIKDAKGDVIGNEIKICGVKNKVGFPFRIAELDIMYGKGVNTEKELLSLAIEYGIIIQKGAYYYALGQMERGMRKDEASELVKTKEIYEKIKESAMGSS